MEYVIFVKLNEVSQAISYKLSYNFFLSNIMRKRAPKIARKTSKARRILGKRVAATASQKMRKLRSTEEKPKVI